MPADFINKLSRMFQDIKVSEDLNNQFKEQQKDRDTKTGDSVIKNVPIASAIILSRQVSIKILNVGAWARTSERVPVTLPRELEDFIPEVNFCHTLKSAYPFPPPPTPLCISQYFWPQGGGVLQDQAQWQKVAVAPPYVQWHSYLCQQVRNSFGNRHLRSKL